MGAETKKAVCKCTPLFACEYSASWVREAVSLLTFQKQFVTFNIFCLTNLYNLTIITPVCYKQVTNFSNYLEVIQF